MALLRLCCSGSYARPPLLRRQNHYTLPPPAVQAFQCSVNPNSGRTATQGARPKAGFFVGRWKRSAKPEKARRRATGDGMPVRREVPSTNRRSRQTRSASGVNGCPDCPPGAGPPPQEESRGKGVNPFTLVRRHDAKRPRERALWWPGSDRGRGGKVARRLGVCRSWPGGSCGVLLGWI